MDSSNSSGNSYKLEIKHKHKKRVAFLLPSTRDSRESLPAPRSARTPASSTIRRPATARTITKPRTTDSGRESPRTSDSANLMAGGGSESLRRQNEELRARLAGESADHRRRLDAYRRAQSGQAALVSRLQAKVLQYKQRCSELETHMHEVPTSDIYRPAPSTSGAIQMPMTPSSAISPAATQTMGTSHLREERIHDLETALRRLDEERRKCEKLMEVNTTLREQLEESHQINEALTNDLQKLTTDWDTLREEMIVKEDEWKDEEQAFNDYYTTEHSRLLNLWREVVSMKRSFTDMQASTERDLYKIKTDVDSAARDISSAVHGMSLAAFTQAQGIASQQETKSTTSTTTSQLSTEELKSELRDLVLQRDRALSELRDRDARAQRLLADLQSLEERCEAAEVASAEATMMRSALEEVARALIFDSEGEVHPILSTVSQSDRSPKRIRTQNSTAFAESTISAVQAALHKYQLHIHELQVKLQNTREQLSTNRKQCEVGESTISSLESKVNELQLKLDQANGDITQLLQEKESLQKTVDSLRSDKNTLERNRIEINAMLESLSSDYEKLQKANARLDKLVEALDTEKHCLQNEVDRLLRDASSRESTLRAEEERGIRMRSELVTLREELNKSYLSRDLLEQQKIESDNLITQMEKCRGDLEIDIERSILEKSELQDAMEKLESALKNSENDKRYLQEETKKLQEEKSALAGQSSDQQSDMNSLRKEILAAEQARLDLEADKASLMERIKFLEGEKEKVELDLGQVTRERGELSSQLSAMGRKKDTLNEEIMRLQQRLEQSHETNGRLNRNLEELVKENEEKMIIIDGNEKEINSLQEQMATLRTDKDALEAVLFDTSNMLEDVDSKRLKLEKQLQETLIREENLKGQVVQLSRDLEAAEKKCRDTKNNLTQQAGKKEAEYQQIISNLTKTSSDSTQKLKDEKEHIRASLEQKLTAAVQSCAAEKSAMEAAARERERRLRAARDALALQHDEAMLRAENDKQQSLLMAHQDQQALIERLEELKRAYDAEQNLSERLKRESSAKSDQDRNTMNQLRDELTTFRNRLEEAKAQAEEECLRFDSRLKELLLEKENCLKECQDIRVQLQLSEDKYDSLTNQLHDTLRKLKENENESESLRKELTDTRRQLSTCTAEREKYSNSNRELRDHVKRAEQERRETARALDEAFHKIAGLEEVRASIETDRARLQSELKDSENMVERLTREAKTGDAELKRERSHLEQLQHDGKEMQSRLNNCSEERERANGEAAQARRHAAELEALLAAARHELGRGRQRGAELEEALRAREQEMVMRLEDCRVKERRLEDLKHNLEVCLADATQQIQELKARLGGAEGRCRALEAGCANAESCRRSVERRLSGVVGALRRVAGVQSDGSLQPQARSRRMTSPARKYSPHREHSEERLENIDVDPELIKKGIRTLMHEVSQIEREKDDYKSQVCVLRKQLKESSDLNTKGEGKLSSVQTNLRTVQDEKARLQTSLSQRQAQLQTQVEALQHKTEELSIARDKITSLELLVSSGSEQKGQYEDKLEKCRSHMSQLETDVQGLREALAASETRASRLDVRRAQLEGDTQRAHAAIREKEMQIQKIQERCEQHTRTLAALEDRCTSLKGTIDQLSASLQKAAASESELRNEMNRLQRQLVETKQNEQSTAEKYRQLQKSLANCDNEKRVLAEKLESAKSALSEVKRVNAQLEDQSHRMSSQMANLEVQRTGLESQLRLTAWDGKDSSADSEVERELHAIQREKSELRAKVDALQDKIRQLESDKSRPVKSVRSKSYERPEKGLYSDGDSTSTKDVHARDSNVMDMSIALLEQENRELKMKIRRLESQLVEKEAELSITRSQIAAQCISSGVGSDDVERYRHSALQAERLLDVREASHRQQISRLESQAAQLRSQLASEVRRRQAYVTRSGRAARDIGAIRAALNDSLRTVSQDPSLDPILLERESRRLDNSLAHSLPPMNTYSTSSSK